MKSVFLTAILSVSLTINVMTYAPQFTRPESAPIQLADNSAQHGFDLMVKRINGVAK